MKTLIIGMGVVGTLHGWALARAGFDVTHKLRPGKGAAHAGGVPLDILDLRPGRPEHRLESYAPRIVEDVSPSDGFELVMVPTKQYQAAMAVEEVRDKLPGAHFLLFTANWRGPAEIDAVLPRSRYLWGYSVASGGWDGGTLTGTIKPVVRLGELDGADSPRLKAVAEMFSRAGIAPSIQPDIMAWLWEHQAINSAMVGTALMAGGLEKPAGDMELMEFMVRAVREGVAVLLARGVKKNDLTEARPFLEAPVAETAKQWQDVFNSEHGRRIIKSGHLKSSPEEMKRLFLDVYETARELKLDTPRLDRIHRAIS